MARYTGLSQGYVVYPDGVGKMSLSAAKAEAKRQARLYGHSRVEDIDTQRTVAKYSIGAKQSNPTTDLVGGDWIPAHAVRVCPDGRVEVLREKNPRGKNPTGFGFRDGAGVFHPIAPTGSYLRSIGKGPKKAKRKAKAKSKKSARRRKK